MARPWMDRLMPPPRMPHSAGSRPADRTFATRPPSPGRIGRLARLALACALAGTAGTAGAAGAAGAQQQPPSAPQGIGAADEARALARQAVAAQTRDPAAALAHGAEGLRQLAAAPPTPAAGPTRVALHNAIAMAHLTLGHYDSAAVSAEAGRRLAEAIGDRPGLATALASLGALAQRRGDPERAVRHLTEALERQRALGADSAAAASLVLLGFVYASDFADYDRALEHQLEALRIRERLGGAPEDLATSLNSLGVVYGRLRHHDRALALFRRALALYRAAGAEARAAGTLSNIGDLLLERGDHAGALAHHRESLALREGVGDSWSLSLAHRNIGLAHLAAGELDAAYAEVRAGVALGAGTGNRGLAVRNLLALAAVERARQRPAAAERTAREALTLAGAMGARELTRRSWEALAEAQEAGGRLREALASQRRYKAVSDSIFDATTVQRLAVLETESATERRERAIERLTSAQAMAALQARQRALQRNVVAGVALLLGACGVAAYRRRGRDVRRAEALSLTDPLTGVRNRRYVREVVARELGDGGLAPAAGPGRPARAERVRPATPGLAFLLLDVDHFKRVNDTLGHGAGDRLLGELALVLEGACGPSDAVVRWGGEEFLVVQRHGDHERARALAECLRTRVAAHETVLDDGQRLRVTCSVGFAALPPSGRGAARGASWSWEALVALADHGTYAAKRLGRNAWVGYELDGHEPPLAARALAPELIEAWVASGRLRAARSSDGPAREAA